MQNVLMFIQVVRELKQLHWYAGAERSDWLWLGGVLCSCPVSAVVIYEHCPLLGRLFSPHILLSSPYHDYFSRGQLSPRSAFDELALESAYRPFCRGRRVWQDLFWRVPIGCEQKNGSVKWNVKFINHCIDLRFRNWFLFQNSIFLFYDTFLFSYSKLF